MKSLKSVIVLTFVVFSSVFANASGQLARKNCTVGTVSVHDQLMDFILNCDGVNISYQLRGAFQPRDVFAPVILAAKITNSKVSVKWTPYSNYNETNELVLE